MTVLAYFADLLYADDTREEKWLTVDERNDLIGDDQIVSATYLPLCGGARDAAVAWLIQSVPGPFITCSWHEAQAHFVAGMTVDGLHFAMKLVET